MTAPSASVQRVAAAVEIPAVLKYAGTVASPHDLHRQRVRQQGPSPVANANVSRMDGMVAK